MRMGEPAGGSLSADEYKLATTVALPLAVSSTFNYAHLLFALSLNRI